MFPKLFHLKEFLGITELETPEVIEDNDFIEGALNFKLGSCPPFKEATVFNCCASSIL
jgi:hypothetical protein